MEEDGTEVNISSDSYSASCRLITCIVVEVDDEEYFSTLSDNTVLMVLFKDDIWSPQGPAYT